LSSGSLNQSCT